MSGEDTMVLSTITVSRGITPDGEDVISVEIPEPEQASLVEVLGLLELAKATAIEIRQGPGARGETP